VIATVFDTKTGASPVSIADLPERLATGGFCWLDIDGASAEQLRAVASALRLEEPTRSWLPRFGQRARFEMGAKQVRISTFTAGATGRPVEVHVLFTRSWLLTVRAGVGSAMDRAHGVYGTFGGEIASNPALGLLIVLDDFIASFHPVLDQVEQAVAELEDQVLRTPCEAQLQQLSALRQQLSSLHRLWEPQREAVATFSIAVGGAPGMSDKAEHFRDYAERIADLIDKIADLRQRIRDAMGNYGTSGSNKQAQIINRLTIISAIFLPMTFLTGFFGMNFHWMIDHIGSLRVFLILGIGLFLSTLVVTLSLFRGRGWLGEEQRRLAPGESRRDPGAAPRTSTLGR
jgi:Mg2+ and Co2+ transporter CorA